MSVCFLLGCLPPSKPPAGQHVMTERALSGVYLSHSEVDGIPSRLLVTGSLQQTLSYQPGRPVSDLYVIPFPGQSSAPERLEGMTPVMKAFVASSQLMANIESLKAPASTSSCIRFAASMNPPWLLTVAGVD